MKEELHQRLWAAQERWFVLRETGATKHGLKVQGIRERGDAFYATRSLIFTGNTRVSYERVLKGFVAFAHARGRERNADIDKRDMRDYLEHLIARSASQSYLDKVRSACVKFGALYGKYESFHAMSARFGDRIRALVAEGRLAAAAHQRITREVAERAIERLRMLDAKQPGRAYHLAAELQLRCGLRACEATERMTADRLVDGQVRALGKGGRFRDLRLPPDLHERLQLALAVRGGGPLADLRAYEAALRRAVLEIGGRATGTHAQRRRWATEHHRARYHTHQAAGLGTKDAADAAIADTLEALGHGRDRVELRRAYLGAA